MQTQDGGDAYRLSTRMVGYILQIQSQDGGADYRCRHRMVGGFLQMQTYDGGVFYRCRSRMVGLLTDVDLGCWVFLPIQTWDGGVFLQMQTQDGGGFFLQIQTQVNWVSYRCRPRMVGVSSKIDTSIILKMDPEKYISFVGGGGGKNSTPLYMDPKCYVTRMTQQSFCGYKLIATQNVLSISYHLQKNCKNLQSPTCKKIDGICSPPSQQNLFREDLTF